MGLGTAAVALDSCTPESVKKESTSNKELRGKMLQNYPGVGIGLWLHALAPKT